MDPRGETDLADQMVMCLTLAPGRTLVVTMPQEEVEEEDGKEVVAGDPRDLGDGTGTESSLSTLASIGPGGRGWAHQMSHSGLLMMGVTQSGHPMTPESQAMTSSGPAMM